VAVEGVVDCCRQRLRGLGENRHIYA
jgi:hypothetical protein